MTRCYVICTGSDNNINASGVVKMSDKRRRPFKRRIFRKPFSFYFVRAVAKAVTEIISKAPNIKGKVIKKKTQVRASSLVLLISGHRKYNELRRGTFFSKIKISKTLPSSDSCIRTVKGFSRGMDWQFCYFPLFLRTFGSLHWLKP